MVHVNTEKHCWLSGEVSNGGMGERLQCGRKRGVNDTEGDMKCKGMKRERKAELSSK